MAAVIPPRQFGTGGPRFGTGADPQQTIKTEGPGLIRTFFNGVALAAGWFTVAGIVNYIKNRPSGDSPSAGYIDEGE